MNSLNPKFNDHLEGKEMYELIERLFPICRSLTGEGVRETLNIIKEYIPELEIKSVPSGTKAFDWEVPKEWNVKSARLIDPDGEVIVDMEINNLHVVGYSEPVDKHIDLKDLQAHLHSIPELPDAIPYVTSYYESQWGFCLSQNDRSRLKSGIYHAKIDSEFTNGVLNYAEVFYQGDTEEEIFFSTYVCHPSMANNELSGPVVATWLVKFIKTLPRRYSYRFIFIPETIGSIVYISNNLTKMQKNVIAGYNLSCVGDDRVYSFLPSRDGNTLSDKVAKHVLDTTVDKYIKYSYLDRGSDERQYCAPGVDLPIASILRSKFGEYPEYHTSLDNLSFVSAQGLGGAYDAIKMCIEIIEANGCWKSTTICEPQLGKRGLYPTLSVGNGAKIVRNLMNVLAYCDGILDIIDIGNKIGANALEVFKIVKKLEDHELLLRAK